MRPEESVIENRDIVYFGSNDWNATVRTSTHQLARKLARRNRVLYVDSLGLRSPRLVGKDVRRIVSKLASFFEGWRVYESPNLYGFVPVSVPLHHLSPIRRLNRSILASSLHRIMRQLHFEKPVLWMFNPNLGELIGHLGEEISIYYCIDDYASFPHVHAEAIRRMERDLLRKVDVAFVSAPSLLDERKDVNANTHLSPHGVDFEHFSSVSPGEGTLFERNRSVKRPVVGYFGLIADPWVDRDLLLHLARKMPEVSIVLIGEVQMDLETLRNQPNVYILGPVPYDELPRAAIGFDVCIIPFQTNRVTTKANPIKAYEYLAMGKPVVSTPIPALQNMAEVVRFGSDGPGFLAQVRDALRSDSDDARDLRRAAVEKKSWDNRLETISEIIGETLAEKRKREEQSRHSVHP